MAFWRLYYHVVWATKNREDLIDAEIEAQLHGYIIGKAQELGVRVYAINGWHDHMHLLVSIPPKHAVAYVVKTLKGGSSYHLNQTDRLDRQFAWQRGYGALSLGQRQVPMAESYINDQKEHHESHSTNAWLERYTELDEGPDEAVSPPEPGLVREARPTYEPGSEPPF